MSETAYPTLPREFTDSVSALGGCLQYEYKNEMWHTNVSAYLVIGDDKTLLIDTGHPAHWDVTSAALDQCLAGRTLDYVLPTHSEMPHAGNVSRLVEKYPDLTIVGDIRDYHLYYPELVAHLSAKAEYDEIDLGGRSVIVLPAIWRDLPSTQWAYDTGSRTMFVADGFSYSHHHLAGQCALLSSEFPQTPDVEQTMFVNERALFWTRHVDSSISAAELTELLNRFPCDMVAPAHGGVIDNLDVMLPIMFEGMDAQRQRARLESVT